MNIQDALKIATQQLLANPNITRARLEAEILLMFVLQKKREFLHGHSECELDTQEKEAFFSLLHRRVQNEPIQYLTQRVSFFSDEFYVDERVLIPRPESEILIQKVCEIIESENLKNIAEIGIGSGALSVSVAKMCKKVFITATDISQKALQVAQKNIAHFGLNSRIKLVQTSLLDEVAPSDFGSDFALEYSAKSSTMISPKPSKKRLDSSVKPSPKPKSSTKNTLDSSLDFDLVFSNPPYIADDYPLPPNVAYEPKRALFGGKKGSEVLESIITMCAKREIKFLACEMGYDQREILAPLLASSGYNAEFYKDLSGLYRGFVARFCKAQL
ncbi:HemK/PrmC family methyltransferase [Helicobacter sp. MIT 01-3238]|uniref:N5-glutamine methyltransferase family protein n=1 Tax=Helicobacter sp. MIT 01-3238 TaxID=398627 RepID=UPI000E1EA694|nr:HemK/PrmC family methyltransferase [Helicobacter sp. MIT 01-3238]RDU52051.1 protein-(glutamine-N5) methyltransferase, release factor-specific [Helicobacter sp. MIT 01-3238]